MKRSPITTALALLLSLAGCASLSSTPQMASSHHPTVSLTPVPSDRPQRAVISVTGRDNGRTITLKRGQRLRVVLSSTYWTFQNSSNRAVLSLDGRPRITRRASGCVAGAGCGTVTATYVAKAAGPALVTATRTSCGEAMGCTDATGRYSLDVVVR